MDLNDRENMAPYIRGARDASDPPNIVHLLNNRQLGMTRKKFPTGLKHFAELKASRSQLKETHCDLPASARSTFLMSFSHDCTKIASSHGDHNIYVSDMKTGKPIKTLEGHPRTPWCIAFHPTSNDILASGCLGGEVRVWDLRGGGSERWRAEHDQVIASLAFHPTDRLLVIATGNSLYFWNWSNPAPDGHCSTNNDLERVRYVKFDPLGFRIITGIANLNNSGIPTGSCNPSSTGVRTNPTCPRRTARDVDIYRLCRRTVMRRLMDLPELETSARQPPNTTQENNTSSSSSATTVNSRVGTSSAANQAGTSSETNRSTSSEVDNESRPHTDSRDRSPVVSRLASEVAQRLLRESICTDVARIVNRWMTEEITPYFYRNQRTSSTELHQTLRTTPEDDFNTAVSPSLIPAESSQSEPSLLAQRGNLQMRNNLESSADHQNNSLSDHHNSPESSMQHSQVNNVGLTAEGLMGACIRLRDYFDNFEGRMSAAVLTVGRALAQASQNDGGQTNETSEPQAGPSQSDGRQTNETSEPRAGPSKSDGGQTNETSEPRAGPSKSDGGQTNETSEPQAGPSKSDGGQTNETFEPRAGPSRGENSDDQQENQPEPQTPRRNAYFPLPDSDDELVNVFQRRLWNLLSKLGSSRRDSPAGRRSTGTNTPVSQISAPEHQSAERRNTVRNAPTALPSSVEKPTVNESEGDKVSRSSPIRVQLPRHHYNRLKAEKRSNSSCLESDKERPESKRQKKQFDETSRSSLENSPSTSQASSSPRSPVIPNFSSEKLSIDMPSSSVTTPDHSSPVAMPISSSSVAAEASSAPINAEDFNTTKNLSEPITTDLMSDITDEVLLVSREETNNEIDMISAEANTQASSSSDSRIYSPRPITLEDMRDECIFTSLFTTHQCDALAGCAPSNVQIPTASYRELQVEDPGDSDDELEIPEPQSPFPSFVTRMENVSDSDLELENPQAQSPVPSSPVTSDVELTSGSGSGSSIRLSSLFDPILDPMSDASSDDSDRPSTPPLLMFSQPYNSLLFTGHSRTALNDPLTHNHRIQVWDFTAGEFPPIYDATANIVVRRCMIHNDASVDISQDGEKLVALIPSEERDHINNLMFGVFSLRPGHLGRTLCIWGYISNAISVSFSPLAQYVVVGSANSRPIYSNPEKAAVAQIIKINKSRDSYDASYVRSFTQVINNDNRLQQVNLNCVRWLPVSGLGIAYATNRGCLCICKPIAGEMFENVPNEASPESTRIGQILHRIRALYRHRPL